MSRSKTSKTVAAVAEDAPGEPTTPPAETVPAGTHIVAAVPPVTDEQTVADAPAEPVAEIAPVVPAPAEKAEAKEPEPAEIKERPAEPEAKPKGPSAILAIDIGGTKVKILATGHTHVRKASTGKSFTPSRLVQTVRELAEGWTYDAITIGYPGLVGTLGPRSEPGNLGSGWVGFDFGAAFEKPVKMINDAAMQALGSYEGGRMLFLGLGTGLGSTLIAGNVIIPLELGHLTYDGDQALWQVLGRRGLERIGRRAWRKAVDRVVITLARSFVVDYVVIGGGNAKIIKELPPGARLGHNLTAFRGGFRLWNVQDVWVLADPGGQSAKPSAEEALRML